jgi:hypothetical protein
VKKMLIVASVMVLVLAFGGAAMATVIDGPIVGGFTTFIDQNTGRVWLDLNNFFDQNATTMVAAANAAGFSFANLTDVQQLLNSLPLTGGEWPGYAAIMGKAPNRELIWGAYFEDFSTVGWAWSYDYDVAWQYDFNAFDWNTVPNGGSADADCNIWAYQTGVVPIPGTMWLLGFGLLSLAGIKRKFRK